MFAKIKSLFTKPKSVPIRHLIEGDLVCYEELSHNPSPEVIATVLYNIQGQVVIRYDDGFVTLCRDCNLVLIKPKDSDQ